MLYVKAYRYMLQDLKTIVTKTIEAQLLLLCTKLHPYKLSPEQVQSNHRAAHRIVIYIVHI